MPKNQSTRSPQTIDIHLGKRIHELRVAQGLSRSMLAESLGITQQQLHKYEKGINRLSVSRLMEIAAALGVDMTALLPPPTCPPPRRVIPALSLR